MYGPRRRTTSEGSSYLQRLETPDSNRQGASSQRHSMNDSTPISVEKERTILRKHSGDTVPSSRSLSHKVACSEIDITGFWSRRLSSQKRAVASSRTRDVSPIQAVNDTDTRPSLLSSPRPILQVSPSVRKPFRPLPRPPVARPQSQSLPQHAALGPPVIPHLVDQAQPMALPASALSLDYLKADIHGDDHIYNKDITKLTSMPSLPAASLASSVTPPSSPSQVIKGDDKEKRRFPHFGFSRLVSSGLGESRKADYAPAPALAPVLPELRPLTPLPPISIVPPIYDAHTLQTEALVLKRQKSSKSIKSVKYVNPGRSVRLQKSQNNLDMRKCGQCRSAGPTQVVDLGTRGDRVQDKSVSNSAVVSAPSFSASVALPLSFMPSSSSLPSPPSHVRVQKERGSENDKGKKRFHHFMLNRLVSSGLGGTKKTADSCVPVSVGALPELPPLPPLPPMPTMPHIYHSRASMKRPKSVRSVRSVRSSKSAKSVCPQKSERRRKRKTGLAQIVVEVAVGAVSRQLDAETVQAAEVREILAHLRCLKAA